MDSKLKKITVAVCVSAMLLLFTLVIGINYIQGNYGKNKGISATKDKETNTTYGDELSEEELREFMDDPFFFNEEQKEPVLVDTSHYVRVTMSLNSVLNDIRVQILDSNEERVTGEEFKISIDGIGEYADEDRDGIIYVDGLEGGEYSVDFVEKEGYKGPNASMKIKVPDVLAYEYIDDIELLIRDEGSYAMENDDMGRHYTDGDGTANTQILEEGVDIEIGCNLGIDVSSFNEKIDWTKVQESGIEFAMIRCGYRGRVSGELIEDAYFRQNVEDAIAVGMKVGVYFTSAAIDEKEAVEEASMAVKLCKEYAISYPIFILQESSRGEDGVDGRADTLDAFDRTVICQAFCETVEHEGYRAGVHASKSWLEEELRMNALTKYYTYLAEYRKAPDYQSAYTFWKYTQDGWIEGVTGRVDLVVGYYEFKE